MDKQVLLYIVRHGETEYNRQMRVQGWYDSPLTENGAAVAAKLGAGLKDIDFACAYSSDLERSVRTAKIILENAGKNIELIIDRGLRERGLGKLEGLRAGKKPWIKAEKKAVREGYANRLDIEELDRLYELEAVEAGDNGSIEPFLDFKQRLYDVLIRICDDSPKGQSNVLVVSHGMAILGMIHVLTEDRYVPRFLKNASVTLIEYIDGKFIIKKVNDLSYTN